MRSKESSLKAAPRRREAFRFADFRNRKLVLYLHPPKRMPPAALANPLISQDFEAPYLESAGADIAGVSADPTVAQSKFRSEHELALIRLSEEDPQNARGLRGLGKKSMYRRTFMDMARATFLIGPDGPNRAHLAEGRGQRPCR